MKYNKTSEKPWQLYPILPPPPFPPKVSQKEKTPIYVCDVTHHALVSLLHVGATGNMTHVFRSNK